MRTPEEHVQVEEGSETEIPLKKKYLEYKSVKKSRYNPRAGNRSGILKRKKQHKFRGRNYRF